MSIEGTCIECGTPSEELRKGICVECAMTDPIQQAIDALLDADCCISPATTTVQEKTVEGIYKAITLLQSLKEQSREPDDLTVAYMAGMERGKDIIKAKYSREPVGWINVDEQLPETGRKVLAHYKNAVGKSRVVIAQWIERYSVESSYDDECNDEYHEENDAYYLKKGWYECIDNWDDFSLIAINEGEVCEWQPLPSAPMNQESE